MKQSFLAKKVGVERQTISEIENGKRNASLALARRIAKETGLTLDEIFQLPAAESSPKSGG